MNDSVSSEFICTVLILFKSKQNSSLEDFLKAYLRNRAKEIVLSSHF